MILSLVSLEDLVTFSRAFLFSLLFSCLHILNIVTYWSCFNLQALGRESQADLWRFVVHDCIDGFFRTVVYLKCLTINRAETVRSHFQGAILRFCCPLRIWPNYGTENIDVARWFLSHHGVHTKSFLTGLSVKNQHNGVLDPVNEKHLFALHYIYLPLINRTLEQFMETWNSHPIWTCGNMSPRQIWMVGFYRLEFSDGDLRGSTNVDKSYKINN